MLVFHSLEHTQWVLEESQRISRYYGLPKNHQDLLSIAAICHDVGYLEVYDGNEKFGSIYAQSIMSSLNFASADIELVQQLILETNLKTEPSSFLSKCLRDADSGYIGTPLYRPLAQELLNEYRSYQKINSLEEWHELQVQFFSNHVFYTGFSQLYRTPYKNKNFQNLSVK